MDLQFPLEIWRLILSHLDVASLKRCLLVSNEFRELMIKTPAIMRKLHVIFFNDAWMDKVPFVEKYGFFVRSIKFDDCGFNSISDLRKILRYTPNVEKLYFCNCYVIDIETHIDGEVIDENGVVPIPENRDNAHQPNNALERENQDNPLQVNLVEDAADERKLEIPKPDETIDDSPIELKRLHLLHLDSCNIASEIVTDLRTCTTLKTLKLTFYYQQPVNYFTDFMHQQHQLEELNLIGWSDMVFKSLWAEDNLDRIHFKLKNFSLECEMGYHVNFINFYQQQAEHIKILELACYNIDFHYYRLLFNHFHNLKTLVLPTDWFLTDLRAADIQNCRIPSLKDLEMVGANDDVSTFKTILGIFPNIECLKAENLMNFCLHDSLNELAHLQYLKAENFRAETMLFTKCQSLKILEISFLFPMSLSFLWENIAENCPNIEQLIIKDIGQFKLTASINKEISIIIRNLVKFKHLVHCEINCSPQEPMVNHDQHANEMLHGAHDGQTPFFRIVIDNDESKYRLMKVSTYIIHQFTDEFNELKRIFSKCDIVEI